MLHLYFDECEEQATLHFAKQNGAFVYAGSGKYF